MAHGKLVDRRGELKPTPISPDAKIRANTGGELDDTFFATLYVYDYLPIKVQHSHDDTTVLIASVSSAWDLVRTWKIYRNAHSSPQEEHRMGHHDRCSKVHYQLAHFKDHIST